MNDSRAPKWIKLSHYAFRLWIEQQKFPKSLMGFDPGLGSTGVSITSSDLKHAFYLTTIKASIRSKIFREQVTSLILKQRPVGLVIGRPNFVVEVQQKESIIDGMDDWIRDMASQHPKTSQIRYTFVDQSWTTLTAKVQLKAIEQQISRWGHLRRQKDLVDGMASIAILRRYLQFYNKN